MFESLEKPVMDSIIHLMAEVRADQRPDLVDLTVGMFKDDEGKTPVMRSVRSAEKLLIDQQDTKGYLGLTGDAEFADLIRQLVLSDSVDASTVAATQTPGGSGALRIAAELIKRASPDVNLWVSEPTWANHFPLLGTVGLKCQAYPYFDVDNQAVDFESLMATVNQIPAGDVMVLHGCCHNPTGCDLAPEQWQVLVDALVSRGIVPLVDLAYLGLGDNIEADAYGVRLVSSSVPVALVAVSCSKNFGAYRDRVGCTLVSCNDADTRDRVFGNMGTIARTLYSMPPDHGAAVVRLVLSSAQLKADWASELADMQSRVQNLRNALTDALVKQSGDSRWQFIARQRGMFSLLGLDADQVATLKDDHGIYVVTGGRINIAGLRHAQVERVAGALLTLS